MNRILVCLIGLAAAGGAAAQDPSQIPIADFVRRPDVERAKLSTGGDYVATSRYVNENKQVVDVTHLATNELTATLALGAGENIGGFWWVNPTRLIASVARAYGRLDQPYLTGELIGIDANGRNRKYLFGYRGRDTATRTTVNAPLRRAWAELTVTLDADPGYALIQVRRWTDQRYRDVTPTLERLDVMTGRTEQVESLGILEASIAADDRGRALLASGQDRSGNYVVLARPAGAGSWKPVSVPGELRRAAVDEVNRDGSAGYFWTYRAGAPTCLHEYRFDSGRVTELKCGNFDSVFMSNAERKPIAAYDEDGLSPIEYLEPEHSEARRLRALSDALPGQRVRVVGTSLDGSKVLLSVRTDRTPGGYYLLDEKSKSLRLIAPRRRWIDPRLMQPMATAMVKARDGQALTAYLTAPEGLKTRKAPLVVLPHGGPTARDSWSWQSEVQLLASRGYAVLQVNFRGSTGYGYDFEMAGYRNFGTKIQDDIVDATRWAIAEGIADPARICIYGTSFGGYSAVMSAAREPDLYKCAAGLAGVYDLETQVGDTDSAASLLGRVFLQEAVGSDEAALREQSPVTHVGRIKAALLIAHGTRDGRVPFSQAKSLRAALDRAKKPYEWLEYEGEEHGLYKEENQIDFYAKLLAFLDKHIGPGAASAKGVGSGLDEAGRRP